ncbi:MAG: hypothetical protein ACTSYI_07700 [Promethearchaeota archaeon]
MDYKLVMNWVGTIFIGIVVLVFIIKGLNHKYNANYLFFSLIFSFIGIFIENFLYLPSNADNIPKLSLIFALHITSFTLYLFFMFMFLNSLVRVKPSTGNLFVAAGFFSVMLIGVWQHYIFFPEILYTNGTVCVTTARLAYDLFGIFVFGLHGMRIYLNIYKKIKEQLAYLFFLSQLFMTLGFAIRAIREVWSLLSKVPGSSILYAVGAILKVILDICDILALIAIIVFLFLYISNIEYIVRLPEDIYFLGIYTLSGLKIYRASFQTSKEKDVEDKILSGIFSAFHSIFKALFKSEHPIDSIQSEDFSLLFSTNSTIMVVVATDRPTFILKSAIKQFLKRFELQFPNIYHDNFLDLSNIEDVRNIIKNRFPFLKIMEDD